MGVLISMPFVGFPVGYFRNVSADSFRGHCFVRCDLEYLILPCGVDLSGTMFVNCNLRGTQFPKDAIFDKETRIVFGDRNLLAGAIVPDHLRFAFHCATKAEQRAFMAHRQRLHVRALQRGYMSSILITALCGASRKLTGADFSNQKEDWINLRDCVFTDCDFRNTKLVGTGVNITGVRFVVSPDKTHLLKGLTVEERNAATLARAITFSDPEAQADTEEGLNTGQMTPRTFLDTFGIVVVPDVDPEFHLNSFPAPVARMG